MLHVRFSGQKNNNECDSHENLYHWRRRRRCLNRLRPNRLLRLHRLLVVLRIVFGVAAAVSAQALDSK